MSTIIIAILLGLAVTICFLCSLGILVMRDAYQRLHFPTSVVSLAALFITIAVFIDDSDPATRIKTVIIVLILFFMNGVLSHMTARAVRIQSQSHWPVDARENIPIHGSDKIAGTPEGQKLAEETCR